MRGSPTDRPLSTETPTRLTYSRAFRLARRLLLLLLVARRRRATRPAFEADANGIEVRQLKGRKRQRDRIGHDAKRPGGDAVRGRRDLIGLREHLRLVAV